MKIEIDKLLSSIKSKDRNRKIEAILYDIEYVPFEVTYSYDINKSVWDIVEYSDSLYKEGY
jgi:hypothetical protein